MKHFKLHFLDNKDTPALTIAFFGHDDLAALNEAKRFSGDYTIEVWEGTRKIAHVQNGNVALTST